MNEFGRQYAEYVHSLTQKQYQIGLLVSMILPVIIVLLFRNTEIVFLLPIVFFPFISPRGIIQKMRSDNLQTWLCLSGDLKDVFAKMIFMTLKRVAVQLCISLSMLMLSYYILHGIDISPFNLIYTLLLMALILIMNVLMWILYARLNKSRVQIIEMISMLIVCILPVATVFIDTSYFIAVIGVTDVLLAYCSLHLINNLTVNKEKFIEGD